MLALHLFLALVSTFLNFMFSKIHLRAGSVSA